MPLFLPPAAAGGGSTVHWITAGGVPSAGLGVDGDLAVTFAAGGVPSGRIGPRLIYRKASGAWSLFAVLPTPSSDMAVSKNSGVTGVGPAMSPSYVVENTTQTPATTVFNDVYGPWTSGGARFFASSTADQAVAIAPPFDGVGSQAIAPAGLQVVSVRVRTRPSEANATVGVGVFGALSGAALSSWYGVFASCDSAGVVGLGILAGSGGTPPPAMFNNYFTSSPSGTMLAGDNLILVRNGPVFTCYAVNPLTYLVRASSTLTFVLPSSVADYQYAAGPGVWIDGSTVARLSDFYAVA